MKKAAFFTVILFITAAAIVFAGGGRDSQPVPSVSSGEVKFPLSQKVTYKVMGMTTMEHPYSFNDIEYIQWLEQETNVRLEFETFGTSDAAMVIQKVNLLFASGDLPDAFITNAVFNDSHVTEFGGAGLFIPLNKYLTDKKLMPNFNSRVLAESPQTLGYVTAPDGNVYCLPGYVNMPGLYLESPIWINKKWLDNLGLKVPATLDELTNVLRQFKQKDANGNGNPNDEIPFIASAANAYAHLEAPLGMWGIPTKGGALENYTTVRNGKVYFVPALNEYKEAYKVYHTWFSEGLLWNEVLTGTAESFASKLTNSSAATVGMIMMRDILDNPFAAEYVRILPPKVPGYNPLWYRHPGGMGIKNRVFVTNKCKNPEYFLGALDNNYTLENAMRMNYGEEKDGRYKIVSGKYEFPALSPDERKAKDEAAPTVASFFWGDGTTTRVEAPLAYTSADYAGRISLNQMEQQLMDNYALYKDIMNNELWPRPYFLAEDSQRVNELRTDIFNTVSQMQGRWLSGQADVEASWNGYIDNLNRQGLEEFVRILQKTYDVYLKGMAK
jgi:putative aldouronate transport system substrate-binding protein